MGVTVCGENFKHTAAELKDRDIERTATEVEYGNLHILVGFVNTVGQGSSRRLIHDTAHIETCNLSGLLCCLTL